MYNNLFQLRENVDFVQNTNHVFHTKNDLSQKKKVDLKFQ